MESLRNAVCIGAEVDDAHPYGFWSAALLNTPRVGHHTVGALFIASMDDIHL